MRWLRRQQDIASLFAVWALLLQVLLGPVSMVGHGLGTSSLGGIMCTTRGLAASPGTPPKQNHRNGDCPGCTHACRIACSAGPGLALTPSAEAPLEAPTSIAVVGVEPADRLGSADPYSDFRSRAPPIA